MISSQHPSQPLLGPGAPSSSLTQAKESSLCPHTSWSPRATCPTHRKGGPYTASASCSPGQQRPGDSSEWLSPSRKVLDDVTGKERKSDSRETALRLNVLSLLRHDSDTGSPRVRSPSFTSVSSKAVAVPRSALPFTTCSPMWGLVHHSPRLLPCDPTRFSGNDRVDGLKGFCE